MKKILLSIMVIAGFAACHKVQPIDRNADTQNPIMPIVYYGEEDGSEVIYLTDYLPQVADFNTLEFVTTDGYEVVSMENGLLTLKGNNTLGVLSVTDKATNITYDIPVLPNAVYEVGMTTQSFTQDQVVVKLLSDYENMDWLVLWQDQKSTQEVNYDPETKQATIALEKAWKKSKGRSFVRVYAYANGKKLNDLLIPMENGKVVCCAKQLTRHDDQAQVLYSLMIDRFHNGNTANDWKMNSPEVLDIVDYQGGDIAGITQKIKEGFFNELGITTIWISPITQNPWDAWGLNKFPNGNKYDNTKAYTKFSGYHGYWPIFATEVEKRFTTDEELHEMLAVAHEHGLNVILDYVANHMHINSPTLQEHPDWHTDSILPDGRRNFELWDEARLTTWFDVHIPTLDLERPEVCSPMIDSALVWLEKFDFDGFRHDACKHIPLNYWRELGAKMKQRYPNRHIWMIGETYGDTKLIGSYVKSGMLNSQFDFNIYHTAIDVFGKPNQSLTRMNETILESLAAYGSHHTMGNISGNHDKCRFISLAGGAVSWNESDKAAGWERHIGVTADGDATKEEQAYKAAMLIEVINLTIPGVPCIYQGDEYAEAGANDPDNRHMLKFEGLSERQQQFRDEVQKLVQMRRNSLPLIYGEYIPVTVTDKLLVFDRTYMGQTVRVTIDLDKLEYSIQ